MARVEVIVNTAIASNHRQGGQSNDIIYVSANTWYKVILSSDTIDLYYVKTTNAGLTWSIPVAIRTGTVGGIAVWFDKWTSGDTGTVIHITYLDSSTNLLYYRSLDTSGDTLGTEITAFTGVSWVFGANTCLAITKSKGSRILIGFDGDGGTETGFVKSNDYPVTAFTTKTNFNENDPISDYFMLAPGNYADTNDIDCIYWDRSASEISLKTYDDSANNWTGVSAETSIATGMSRIPTGTVEPQFSLTMRHTDSHLLLVAWSSSDTLNADLRMFDINGAASITEKTNVVLNSGDDQGGCVIGLDTTDDSLYVFYIGKSDGSETAYTAVNLYYKKSTDGGTTWGSETLLSTTGARSIAYLSASNNFASGEFVVDWGGAHVSNLGLYTAAISGTGGTASLLGYGLVK